MSQVKDGDTVRVVYTSRLADGSMVASCGKDEPFEFTIGESEVVPGFEQAVIGMIAGETKTVTVPADEAYGPYQKELVIRVKRSQLHMDQEPVVGHMFQVSPKDQPGFPVWVTEISKKSVTLDANHPLAGKDLTFEITLIDILSSSGEEGG